MLPLFLTLLVLRYPMVLNPLFQTIPPPALLAGLGLLLLALHMLSHRCNLCRYLMATVVLACLLCLAAMQTKEMMEIFTALACAICTGMLLAGISSLMQGSPYRYRFAIAATAARHFCAFVLAAIAVHHILTGIRQLLLT
ncbi:hypothetical protein ACO0LM_17420 [Undibacterium sp. Di26W]|uniref:hypothetical protein n=1 Tax=Undibacterium sp. Di26W TaxID=3413035 RepID=UPI003BF3CD13